MLVCALHVHAFVLNSSEHSGSQLRSSKQPSVAQLNPFPSHPHPPPLFLVRQKDSCALQRAMFWVVEQGARPAQQLRLCIYIIWLFHPLFSIDFGPICTPASLPDCPQITLNTVLNFIVLCEMFVRAADYMTWFGMVPWSAACYWLSLSCWLHTSIISSSQFLPEEQPATWSIGYVKIAPASSLPGAKRG